MAPPGTTYFPDLPYFDPNGNMPAIEDAVNGLTAQIIIPAARSIVVFSDGLSAATSQSDGISFDPNHVVISQAGPSWVPTTFRGMGNAWATFDGPVDTAEFGRFIDTSIVLNGNEPWLRKYTIAEAGGVASDDIVLSKSVDPGFAGHLEVDFGSDVPEPSFWLLQPPILVALVLASHFGRKRASAKV
jgi:hypothetical protein